jgi:hypothetical protein
MSERLWFAAAGFLNNFHFAFLAAWRDNLR